jgi:hypothetical protein
LGRRDTPPRKTLLLRPRSYGLMRRSHLALPSFGNCLVREVFAGCYQPLLPPGSSRRYLCESFLGCLVPCHGGATECMYLFLPPCHRPSPTGVWVGLPASTREHDFPRSVFSRLQTFLNVQASEFAHLPDRSYPAHTAAGQLRLLRPSRTCFVTSACIGYASRPNTGNWRHGDSHPARFAALSAAPPCLRFTGHFTASSAKLGAERIATPFS